MTVRPEGLRLTPSSNGAVTGAGPLRSVGLEVVESAAEGRGIERAVEGPALSIRDRASSADPEKRAPSATKHSPVRAVAQLGLVP